MRRRVNTHLDDEDAVVELRLGLVIAASICGDRLRPLVGEVHLGVKKGRRQDSGDFLHSHSNEIQHRLIRETADCLDVKGGE